MPGHPLLLRLVLPLAAVPAVLVPGGVAAADGGETHCRVVKEDVLAPGLTLQGSSGTFRTATTGVITCEGDVSGAHPTGPGTYTEQGRYGTEDPDSCLQGGEAEGIFSLTIPTERGVVKVTREFRVTYGPLAGKVEGADFHGTVDLIPAEGDCVLRPVTRLHVTQELTFFAA